MLGRSILRTASATAQKRYTTTNNVLAATRLLRNYSSTTSTTNSSSSSSSSSSPQESSRTRTTESSPLPSLSTLASSFFRPEDQEPIVQTPKPPTRAWFQGKPAYSDSMLRLRELEHKVRKELYARSILPSYSCDPTKAFPKSIALPTEQEINEQEQAAIEKKVKDEDLTFDQKFQLRLNAAIQKESSYMDLSQLRQHFEGLPVTPSEHNDIIRACDNLRAFLPLARLADSLAPSQLTNDIHSLISTFLAPLNVVRVLQLEKIIEAELKEEEGREGQETSSTKSTRTTTRNKKLPKVSANGTTHAVGKRKTAVANVILTPVKGAEFYLNRGMPGNPEHEPGQILVNGKPMSEIILDNHSRLEALRPLIVTGTVGQFNAYVYVKGGGISSRAGAISLAIAKGLTRFHYGAKMREILAAHNLLTRDPRMNERKKTNQPGSRKKFRWVKR